MASLPLQVDRCDSDRRIFETVLHAPKTVTATYAGHPPAELPSVGAQAQAIRRAELRMVLDAAASAACRDRIRSDRPLELGDPHLRFPARSIWLEWFGDPEPDGSLPKFGAFIESGESGRDGRITCYYRRNDGRTDLIVMAAIFDLDLPVKPRRAGELRLRHAGLPALDGLFDHVIGAVDDRWWAHIARTAKPRGLMAEASNLAGAMWFHLPVSLALVELLLDRGEPTPHVPQPDRCRPDQADRTPALRTLDRNGFVEVSLSLAAPASNPAFIGGSRSTARAHVVRGHRVTRFGKTFWRRAHVRGDGDPIPKVVNIRGLNAPAPAQARFNGGAIAAPSGPAR